MTDKGVIYTTYFAKHKKAIGRKIGIVRFVPKWLDLEKENIINIKALSPSKKLLYYYKVNQNWGLYKNLFFREMQNRDDMLFALKKLKTILDKGQDITLICYEKNKNTCHRSLLGEYFKKLGYEVNEII